MKIAVGSEWEDQGLLCGHCQLPLRGGNSCLPKMQGQRVKDEAGEVTFKTSSAIDVAVSEPDLEF